MRRREAEVQEKWFILVLADELQRLIGKQVVRVHDFFFGNQVLEFGIFRNDVGQIFSRLIPPEKIGVVVVGLAVREIAVEEIEALIRR